MALIRFSLRSSKYRNNSSGSVGSLACCNASMIAAFSPTHRPPDGLHGTVGFPDVPFQVSDIGLDSFLLHVGNGCSHMDGGGLCQCPVWHRRAGQGARRTRRLPDNG